MKDDPNEPLFCAQIDGSRTMACVLVACRRRFGSVIRAGH
jgi:hypothetical protein